MIAVIFDMSKITIDIEIMEEVALREIEIFRIKSFDR
jgi:hypothetical protein